jgi:hypothetical protein
LRQLVLCFFDSIATWVTLICAVGDIAGTPVEKAPGSGAASKPSTVPGRSWSAGRALRCAFALGIEQGVQRLLDGAPQTCSRWLLIRSSSIVMTLNPPPVQSDSGPPALPYCAKDSARYSFAAFVLRRLVLSLLGSMSPAKLRLSPARYQPPLGRWSIVRDRLLLKLGDPGSCSRHYRDSHCKNVQRSNGIWKSCTDTEHAHESMSPRGGIQPKAGCQKPQLMSEYPIQLRIEVNS